MNPRFILSLDYPAAVVDDGVGSLTVSTGTGTVRFSSVTTGVAHALEQLKQGTSSDELSRVVAAFDGERALPQWFYRLGALERNGGIVYEVRDGDRLAARARIMSVGFRPGLGVISMNDDWVLSRFARIRRADQGFVIESPLSAAIVELFDISRFGVVVRGSRDVADDTSRDILCLLEYCGMLARVDALGRAVDEPTSLAYWHFSDLLFHRHCRTPRYRPGGGNSSPTTTPEPLPAFKRPMSEHTMELFTPDLTRLSGNDVPLTNVIEHRRSVREYDDQPLDMKQLGEFLYRAGRSKRGTEIDCECPLHEGGDRPYPAAGSCYELELYLAVARCEDLAAGFYHYDPRKHRLEILSPADADFRQLLDNATGGMNGAVFAQVLIVIGARFGRVMTSYGRGSYALILKDVGVLLGTMYLVATAMQLAPCALGGGDGELFARMIGSNFEEETSVGEFMLGRRRSVSAAAAHVPGDASR